MSKRPPKTTRAEKFPRQLERIKRVREITEYRLSTNGLRVLFAHRPGTGVVTSNILYLVGSRDENRGETGIAHMLEHMLFKRTAFDIERKTDSASMHFEREYGVTLNANTWKDRTTYYFSYPKEHFERALRIEAERMQNLILTDEEFRPEQTNVLSEFDMYAGDEQFSLSVGMAAAAFESHTYGHETIGFRDDIASFTVEKLERFYRNFYTPENAILMVVGDIDEKELTLAVQQNFGHLKNPEEAISRFKLSEPKQEGRRLVEIRRPSKTNVYAIGMKHAAFPEKEWFETMIAFDILAGGKDSVLHRALVDAGMVSKLDHAIEPTKEMNLGILFFTLAPGIRHAKIEKKLLRTLGGLSRKTVASHLKKTIAKSITHEFVSRENSLGYTAELVEYASAGKWEAFFDTEAVLRSIRPDDVIRRVHDLFEENNIVIGHFVGTKK